MTEAGMLALDWWEAQGLLLTKSEQTTKAALGPSKQWAGYWEWPAQGTICPSDEVGDIGGTETGQGHQVICSGLLPARAPSAEGAESSNWLL